MRWAAAFVALLAVIAGGCESTLDAAEAQAYARAASTPPKLAKLVHTAAYGADATPSIGQLERVAVVYDAEIDDQSVTAEAIFRESGHAVDSFAEVNLVVEVCLVLELKPDLMRWSRIDCPEGSIRNLTGRLLERSVFTAPPGTIESGEVEPSDVVEVYDPDRFSFDTPIEDVHSRVGLTGAVASP